MSESDTQMSLDRVQKAIQVEVVSIHGGWGIRHRLNAMGIHQGDLLVIKRSGIMGGPILIQVHGMEVALGKGMARKIIVQKK